MRPNSVWLRPASPPTSKPVLTPFRHNPATVCLEPDLSPPLLPLHEFFLEEEEALESGDHLNTSDPEYIPASESDYSDWDIPRTAFKYKKVAQKVHPVNMQIPEHLKPRRQFPEDPLRNLPKLPSHPPDFHPTQKVTAERMASLGIDKRHELLPDEKKLLQYVIVMNERSIAFSEDERGTFRKDYFSDYVMPTVDHHPWTEKNIPLPNGYYDEIIQLLKDKIRAGVYERANTAYRSRWFWVAKKDGGIRIVHDLQKLNGYTIRDASTPPIIEEFVEAYAGRSVYTVLDMYWGFHARMLDVHSRDKTAFQTPLGAFRLTSLPMGFANAPAEFQDCMMFILQDEVPEVAGIFIDDVPIKGPPTRYLTPEGKEELFKENPGIRRYIWEHINDVHRILHRLGEAGGTVSAKKMQLCQEEVVIVGHKCSAKGREPINDRTQRILKWPTPVNLREARGFLGLCGTVRIWIKDYSIIAKPIVHLTRKGVDFEWGPEQEQAFNRLKQAVSNPPALRPIDYTSNNPVIFSVDSSKYGIGFVLSQEDNSGKRVPARYGSLPLKPTEVNYSQAKLELFGLFRALRRFRAHLVGAKRLIIELDAKFVPKMLEHPDDQASAVLNRWIEGVLQFSGEIVHVPAKEHEAPDGLSRRRYEKGDTDVLDETDPEAWLENIALPAQLHPDSDPRDSSHEDNDSIPHSPSSPQSQSLPHIIDDPVPQQEADTIPLSTNVIHQYSDQDLTQILTYLATNKVPKFRTSRKKKLFLSKAKPFYLEQAHMYKRRPGHPPQVVIFPHKRRREILWEMHEEVAHHGTWAVEKQISLRYFWPGMKKQIQQHIRSCHSCQLRSTKKMHLPVTISHPPSLFSKVYLDVMKMPLARGKQWLIGCRDDLSGITECKAIARDKAKVIAKFFLKRIILRYGMVQEVVTDNGPSFRKEFAELLKKYGIRHIKISPYNSQANGVVERGHFNIREALVKLCDGDLSQWPLLVPAVSFADRITIRRATEYSPYYLLHGDHPLMPGDLADATFMITQYKPGMTSTELIEARARQLLRLPQDIARARLTLQQSRFRSKKAYEEKFARRIQKDAYEPGDLVLIRNNPIENSVSIERKTANRYMGPYCVTNQTLGGSYALQEMDGTPLKHNIAAFRLIPYVKRQELDAWADQAGITNESGDGSETTSHESESSSDPRSSHSGSLT